MPFHKQFTNLVERALRGGLGHDVFFGLLDEAAANVLHAAELLDQALLEFPDADAQTAAIVDAEHEGDRITREVLRRLNAEFVTPIDREDIHGLISALDDIVDLIDEVAGFLSLYHVEAPMGQAQELAGVLVDAARQLAAAVSLLGQFEDVSEHVIEVHRLENEGDRIVRTAIASLFIDGIDPIVVIRWKDIFERLEEAIDATERAAYLLEGIVIKNT